MPLVETEIRRVKGDAKRGREAESLALERRLSISQVVEIKNEVAFIRVVRYGRVHPGQQACDCRSTISATQTR